MLVWSLPLLVKEAIQAGEEGAQVGNAQWGHQLGINTYLKLSNGSAVL